MYNTHTHTQSTATAEMSRSREMSLPEQQQHKNNGTQVFPGANHLPHREKANNLTPNIILQGLILPEYDYR